MTYQFKYMDVPEAKEGRRFNPVKILVELCLTIVIVICLYNYHTSAVAKAGSTKQAEQPFQTAAADPLKLAAQKSLYAQASLEHGQDTAYQAHELAERFVATGDLSEFEMHTQDGAQDLDF